MVVIFTVPFSQSHFHSPIFTVPFSVPFSQSHFHSPIFTVPFLPRWKFYSTHPKWDKFLNVFEKNVEK